MQIELGKTLDVELVERQLAQLWQQTTSKPDDGDAAVLRARVANLLVFVASESELEEVRNMMTELTARHPSRVQIMLGELDREDTDIEMSVESYCQTDKRTGAKRLCCEEVVMKAQGKFVSELPSAALPLLVPDLSTFVWWRAEPQITNRVFRALLRASDRLVVDSADFAEPQRDLVEIDKIYNADEFNSVGISDINWARITVWRGLLADFYDVPAYQSSLNKVDEVRVDYVGPERASESFAPQALFISGWLASRLGWKLSDEKPKQVGQTTSLSFTRNDGRPISLELNRVEPGERKPGRLVKVELRCDTRGNEPASFVVERSADNLHILSEARLGSDTHRGRVLPVRNRSTAQLLSREMEILCNDQIYQEAIAVAANIVAEA